MTHERARVATTFFDDSLAEWDERTTAINRDDNPLIWSYRQLMAAARTHPALVVQGCVSFRRGYIDLIVALRLRKRKNGPLVFVSECTWEPGSRAMTAKLNRLIPGLGRILPIDRLSRWSISQLNGPNVHFGVLSAAEREIFSRTWGIPVDRISVTPYYASLTEAEMAEPTSVGDYVFAGGDPLRNYELLVSAAESLGVPVRIASRRFPGPGRSPLPSNITAGPVGHEEFARLLRGCAAVAVPLSESPYRSAGQQTYLNALALRKPVVVTDALGVRDYLTHRKHAIIVPPDDPAAFAQGLAWVLAPENRAEVDAMCKRGFELVRGHHLKGHYEARMLEVVDQQLALRARPAPRLVRSEVHT